MPTAPTIVFLHAHPDDESSGTSGSMARAADQGARVVLVVATNGDHGTTPEDLAEGETVVDRRRAELAESARILGIARVDWLGYADSGMTGWEQNAHEHAFANADVDEAARALARILDEEDADILVGYDWHGGYGHPDHVQVHHVAHRAAALAARPPRLLEVTLNRDLMRAGAQAMREQMAAQAAEAGQSAEAGRSDQGDRSDQGAAAAEGANPEPDFDAEWKGDDGNGVGTDQAGIDWQVDVSDLVPRRRAAMAAHGSQSDVAQMLSMPEEMFASWFSQEHYIEPGLGRPEGPTRMQQGWPFG